MVNAFIRVADREKKKQKGRQNSNRDFSLDLTVVFPYIAIFMLFFSTGDGIEGLRKWILFAEASTAGGGGGGGFWSYYSVVSPSGIAIAVTAMAGIALAATIVYSRRGSLKSPWALRKRKYALQPKQWKSLFTLDGKLGDGGVKFLKKVRSGVYMTSTVQRKKETPLEDRKEKSLKDCGNGAAKFLNVLRIALRLRKLLETTAMKT
ncbi:hypothetical protein Gorai_017759, partial [Gossypium raimondii]|nr:hypothetical protein [Gossypium raimondii]